MIVKDLLEAIRLVSPAVSKSKDAVLQGGMVVFKDGFVHAFNDEVYCRAAVPNLEIEGAVPCEPLRNFLTKLPSGEAVRVKQSDSEEEQLGTKIKMRVGRVSASFNLQDIIISLPNLEASVDLECAPILGTKIEEAASAALKDPAPERFYVNVVHFGEGYAESTDAKMAVRGHFNHPFKPGTMLRASSIRGLGGMQLQRCSETKAFAVFETDAFLMAVRKYEDEYPELERLLRDETDKDGTFEFKPSEQLSGSVQRAHVFTKDTESEQVKITLHPDNTAVVEARGPLGVFNERSDSPSTVDKPVSFKIHPKLMARFVEQFGSGTISSSNLLRFCLNNDLVAVFFVEVLNEPV